MAFPFKPVAKKAAPAPAKTPMPQRANKSTAKAEAGIRQFYAKRGMSC